MRTAGLAMSDVWAHRVLHESGVHTEQVTAVEADIEVMVDTVVMHHHGPDQKFRPYLHITGELQRIVPRQALPLGITEVSFDRGRGEQIDAFYEFSDIQLVGLAQKGYFTPSFMVPNNLSGIPWELPTEVDALVLAPQADDPDAVPVVFTHVHRAADLDINHETSGYDLIEYFPDFTDHDVSAVVESPLARMAKVQNQNVEWLFDKDAELDEHSAEQTKNAITSTACDGLAAEVAAIEAELAEQAQAYEQELAMSPGSTEQVFAEQIVPALHSYSYHDDQSGVVDQADEFVPVDDFDAHFTASAPVFDFMSLDEDLDPAAVSTVVAEAEIAPPTAPRVHSAPRWEQHPDSPATDNHDHGLG